MLAAPAVGLNRVFCAPNVGGRESDASYPAWEYRWGQEVVREYLEPAGDLKGKSVLDVGCGLGDKTAAYAEGDVAMVPDTDSELRDVRASCVWARDHAPAVARSFFAGDASALPVADGVFDTVVANDAMEHFNRPERALREMARAVKPGGAIWIFFTPHFSPLGSHLYDYIHAPWCHLVFRRQTLERAVARVLVTRESDMAQQDARLVAAHIMARYDTARNHMSVRWFERICRAVPGLKVVYRELCPARYRILTPLTHVPGIREIISGFVVCRLRRTVS